jgi:hypothetical protein
VRLAVAAVVLAGCARHPDPCARARAREIALAEPDVQPIIRSSTATPAWRNMCNARYTSETFACFERATKSGDLANCPLREIRAAGDIPDDATCQSLAAHVGDLARSAHLDEHEQANLASTYALSCRRDLVRSVVA